MPYDPSLPAYDPVTDTWILGRVMYPDDMARMSTRAALDILSRRVPTGSVGLPNGAAVLDGTGKLPPSVIPAGVQIGRVTTVDVIPADLVTVAPSFPSGTLRITGQVVARNTTTGDSVVWDVAVAAKVSPAGGKLFGTSAFLVFIEDSTMTACGVVASASSLGIKITVTGLAGASIAWACSFSTPLEA